MVADRRAAGEERRQVIDLIENGKLSETAEASSDISAPPKSSPASSDENEDDPSRLASLLSSRQIIGRVPDDAILTRDKFDRAIPIPGTDAAFRVGGNVIVNANYDFDNLGFQDISFQPTIPLDGDSEDASNSSVSTHGCPA